jgi:hypothetical protein
VIAPVCAAAELPAPAAAGEDAELLSAAGADELLLLEQPASAHAASAAAITVKRRITNS